MSDEIKMSHMFAIPVRQHYSVVVDRNENQCSYSTQVEYAAHAINNHDRLVEESKQLREALSHAYDLLLISGWDDYYADKIRLITGLLDGGEE